MQLQWHRNQTDRLPAPVAYQPENSLTEGKEITIQKIPDSLIVLCVMKLI
jgi:hypothetical protein